MSTLGLAWAGEDNISAARMNSKTIWHGTGTQLAALSPIYPGQIVVSMDATGGFNADFVYYRSADNLVWLPLSMAKHTHSADTDSTGGLMSDIVYDNIYDILWINATEPTQDMFLKPDTSGGTVFDDTTATTGKLRVETGAVANQYCHIARYGLKLNFAKKSRFSIKMGLDQQTGLVTRVGVCGESTNGANTNTRKYGIEGCDSSGINWQIYSGNGTARTGAIDTGSVLQAGADATGKHYRVDFLPSTNVKFFNNGTNCGAACTKTTNVPVSGDSGADYVVRVGTKTTNTTNKKIGIWGLSFIGRISDVWF